MAVTIEIWVKHRKQVPSSSDFYTDHSLDEDLYQSDDDALVGDSFSMNGFNMWLLKQHGRLDRFSDLEFEDLPASEKHFRVGQMLTDIIAVAAVKGLLRRDIQVEMVMNFPWDEIGLDAIANPDGASKAAIIADRTSSLAEWSIVLLSLKRYLPEKRIELCEYYLTNVVGQSIKSVAHSIVFHDQLGTDEDDTSWIDDCLEAYLKCADDFSPPVPTEEVEF